jgi:hypothetical protein
MQESTFCFFQAKRADLLPCVRTHLALRHRRAGQFAVRCDRVSLLGEQPCAARSDLTEGTLHSREHGRKFARRGKGL